MSATVELESLDPSGSYLGLLDPVGTTALARDLARQLQSLGPTQIATWNFQDEALASAVASQLGIRGCYVFDDAGRAELVGSLDAGDRVVAVIASVRSAFDIAAIKAIAERSGAALVAVGTLTNSSTARGSGVPIMVAGDTGPRHSA